MSLCEESVVWKEEKREEIIGDALDGVKGVMRR